MIEAMLSVPRIVAERELREKRIKLFEVMIECENNPCESNQRYVAELTEQIAFARSELTHQTVIESIVRERWLTEAFNAEELEAYFPAPRKLPSRPRPRPTPPPSSGLKLQADGDLFPIWVYWTFFVIVFFCAVLAAVCK
jgi:hypothetical protein